MVRRFSRCGGWVCRGRRFRLRRGRWRAITDRRGVRLRRHRPSDGGGGDAFFAEGGGDFGDVFVLFLDLDDVAEAG